MTDFLSVAAERSRLEEEARAMDRPVEVIRPLALARGPRRSLLGALAGGAKAPRRVVEVRRASPVRGTAEADLDVAEAARRAERGGAAAVCVPTARLGYEGSLADLAHARAACGLPILRRDFVASAYGVYESAAGGADALVLVAGAAPLYQIEECLSAAIETGLDLFFEVSDEDDLRKALHLEPPIVAVSARDPRTLDLDPGLHERLRNRLPAGSLAVAVGGIRSAEDVERLRRLGYAAMVVCEG